MAQREQGIEERTLRRPLSRRRGVTQSCHLRGTPRGGGRAVVHGRWVTPQLPPNTARSVCPSPSRRRQARYLRREEPPVQPPVNAAASAPSNCLKLCGLDVDSKVGQDATNGQALQKALRRRGGEGGSSHGQAPPRRRVRRRAADVSTHSGMTAVSPHSEMKNVAPHSEVKTLLPPEDEGNDQWSNDQGGNDQGSNDQEASAVAGA